MALAIYLPVAQFKGRSLGGVFAKVGEISNGNIKRW